MHRSSSPSRRAVGLLLGVCFSVASVHALAAPATAPAATIEAVEQDYAAAKYQDAIKKAVQLLQTPGDAGKAIDKAKVLSIKAESHLHLKQVPLAVEAWNSAAKESTDPKQAAVYQTTAMLIKKSTAGKYQPKVTDAKAPKPEALDVLDPESRKKAMAALFTDESKTVLAKVESLKKQKSLPPVLEGVKQVSDLRLLEQAATDSDATTKQIFTDLTDHAVELIKDATTKMSEKVETISKDANQSTNHVDTMPDGSQRTTTRKRGLFSNDTAALNDVVATCANITDATDGLAKALGAEASRFETTKASATKLSARAEEVLKADYGKTTGYDQTTRTQTPVRSPQQRTPQTPNR